MPANPHRIHHLDVLNRAEELQRATGDVALAHAMEHLKMTSVLALPVRKLGLYSEYCGMNITHTQKRSVCCTRRACFPVISYESCFSRTSYTSHAYVTHHIRTEHHFVARSQRSISSDEWSVNGQSSLQRSFLPYLCWKYHSTMAKIYCTLHRVHLVASLAHEWLAGEGGGHL